MIREEEFKASPKIFALTHLNLKVHYSALENFLKKIVLHGVAKTFFIGDQDLALKEFSKIFFSRIPLPVDPRSNPGSGSALLMSEKSQAVYYISSCHILIDKALSNDKPNGHWFEVDWLQCKRDALSSNRKVDGSRLTGSTQACHS